MLFYSQAEIDHHQAWPSKAGKLIHEPVYISIDKDVLRKQDSITDWSNGDMTLMQLQAVLRIIYAHEKVIGMILQANVQLRLTISLSWRMQRLTTRQMKNC